MYQIPVSGLRGREQGRRRNCSAVRRVLEWNGLPGEVASSHLLKKKSIPCDKPLLARMLRNAECSGRTRSEAGS